MKFHVGRGLCVWGREGAMSVCGIHVKQHVRIQVYVHVCTCICGGQGLVSILVPQDIIIF